MFSNIFSGLSVDDLPVNRESALYITGTWVSALRENTTYHIEHKPKTKAAPLRTVCLSSSNVRGSFQHALSSVQLLEFALLFSEREQSGPCREKRDSGQKCRWATNWP